MIFVTVGTQGRFDRLIRAIDAWAGARGRTEVFAQTGPSNFTPQYIQVAAFLSASEFRQRVESASLVIAHAGMGSIITALELGKQIIVMPRRADLGEHRNDHQIATARRFAEQGRIIAVANEQELSERLDQVQTLHTAERPNIQVSSNLIGTIRTFIETHRVCLEDRDVRF